MKCTSPLKLKSGATVRCGQCMACRISRTSEWTLRLVHEMSQWRSAVFVTFTYRQEAIPADRSLDKSECQRAIKRLRKAVDAGSQIKYYCNGEYGDAKGRPHYHGIFFGVSLDDHTWKLTRKGDKIATSGPLYDAWRTPDRGHLGNVFLGECTQHSIRYVAGYVQKKLYGNDDPYEGRLPPFSLMSKGLGLGYVADHYFEGLSNVGFVMNGVVRPIPRFYRKKYPEYEELYQAEALHKRLVENMETVEYLEKRSRFLPLRNLRGRLIMVEEEQMRIARNAVGIHQKKASLKERKQ